MDLETLQNMLTVHDELERDLRTLKHELATACADYGRSKGLFGFGVNHLRVRLVALREMV